MQTSNSYLPISTSASLLLFFSSVSHTLSCNSILMGFIGLAIHLSAAAQFNYIREPSRLSPDNLQHSPPSHAHTHSRAPLRLHTHGQKKKKSNFSLTMVAQRWNNQQKPHPSTHSADTYWVCVCLCNVYDCVWLCVLRDSFKTISHIYIISDLWKVAESNFIVLSGAHTYMHTNEKSFTHFP